MPIYEYKCVECGEEFDAYKKISENKEKETCPSCGGESLKLGISLFRTSTGGKKGESCGPVGSPFG
jgi:putative FmdB family regulatory protein